MILLIGLIYFLGIFVFIYFLAIDTQTELAKQGYYYDFSRVFKKILSKPRKIIFTSWFGVIWYLIRN